MHPNMQKWEKIRGIVFVNVQQACIDNILTELRSMTSAFFSFKELKLNIDPKYQIYIIFWDQYQSRPNSYQYKIFDMNFLVNQKW